MHIPIGILVRVRIFPLIDQMIHALPSCYYLSCASIERDKIDAGSQFSPSISPRYWPLHWRSHHACGWWFRGQAKSRARAPIFSHYTLCPLLSDLSPSFSRSLFIHAFSFFLLLSETTSSSLHFLGQIIKVMSHREYAPQHWFVLQSVVWLVLRNFQM